MKIILGSSSPRRKHILKELGLEFEILAPDIDEKAIRSTDFKELPLLVARAKAESLKSRVKEPVIVIVADSVVVAGGKLMEKPESEAEAMEFLRSYGAHPVYLYSGLVVFNTETGEQREGVETTTIYFRKFDERVIQDLVAHGEVMGGSGALILENPTIKQNILHVEGEWESASGLPKSMTLKFLEELKK